MKNRHYPGRLQGFALLLVLIMVSFATIIALLFLISARQERSGTGVYAQGSAVRQLASQAVNIVISQINTATHEGSMATPISWASQPGMIRTYNTSGKLSNAYKLYSWGNMIEGNAAAPPYGSLFDPMNAAELPSSLWTSLPAQYTDLNAPVNSVYPIVDPAVLDQAQTSSSFGNGASPPSPVTPNSAGISWDFPGEAGLITSTAAYTGTSLGYTPSPTNTVPMPVQWLYVLQDGTWITPASATGNTATFSGTGNSAPSATNPIVGRIAFWTDDETAKVNVNTAGEGAYWDTPKAGTMDELQFAGNPPLQYEFERLAGHPSTTSLSAVFPELLGASPSVSGNPLGFGRWISATGAPNTYYQSALQSILGYGSAGGSTSHGLNPRLSYGTNPSGNQAGSQGGTYPINAYQSLYDPPVANVPGGFPPASTWFPSPNTDRLYATPDDVYFQPTPRTKNAAFQNAFTPAGGTAPSISPQALSQRLFFLTANSKAPETTLYDTPRVSMWPITWPDAKSSYYVSPNLNGATKRTVPAAPSSTPTVSANLSADVDLTYQEKLLAFCSTLNEGYNTANASTATLYPYFFQRQDPDSPTWDWSQIPRNKALVNYLTWELDDSLASNPYWSTSSPNGAPGIGDSLGHKWDQGMTGAQAGTTDWITLNCFDYLRSMVNQYTLSPTATTSELLYSYTGMYDLSGVYNSETGNVQYTEPNSFTVAPLNVTLNGSNNYVTEGSYPSLREASLVFYATSRTGIPTYTPPSTSAQPNLLSDIVNPANWSNLITWNGTTGNSRTASMQMVMLLDFSQMNPGIVGQGTTGGVYQPVFWVRVSSPTGASFSVTPASGATSSIGFPASGGNDVQVYPIGVKKNAASPEYASFLYQNKQTGSNFSNPKTFSNTNPTGTNAYQYWSLISNNITGINGATSFSFTGCPIQIDIYAIDPSGNINIDPTGTASNKICSYTVHFENLNNTSAFTKAYNPITPGTVTTGLTAGQFPVPIAPYWNVRQAPMQTSAGVAVTTAQLATPPPGMTVNGGVLTPYFGSSNPSSPGWQSEIVPVIGNLNNTISPTQPWGAYRSSGSVSLNPTDNTANTENLMYAFQASSTLAVVEPVMGQSTTPVGYTSMNFTDRVGALPLTAIANGFMGATLDSPAYSNVTTAGTSQTTFFGSDATAGLEAPELVTPYDTAMSMVVDPTAGNQAGDPRLTGRGIVGGTSQVTFSPINLVCPSVFPVSVVTPLTSSYGLSNFGMPKFLLTAGAQYHELGSPSPYLQITGIKPAWFYSTSPVSSATPTIYTMAIRGGASSISVGSYATPTTITSNGNSLLMGKNAINVGLGVESNVLMGINYAWDYTRLPGNFADGGYLLRPDQEYQSVYPNSNVTAALDTPYFEDSAVLAENYGTGAAGTNLVPGFFSPNRQVPSPVILGTLPDSLTTGWQTLNFCPNPAITMNTGGIHPGTGSANTPSATGAAYSSTAGAPDHLLLDLFWMPVAEPYPISEEFATAGKVNLNYAMMPFPYIQRKTALDALLKSVWITAMPSPTATASTANFPQYYKSYGMLYNETTPTRMDKIHTRYPINVDYTLRAFDYKFQKGDIFRVASQICDMFLYPNDPNNPDTLWGGDTYTAKILGGDAPPSTTNITNWWAANSFTADNEREAPYNAIYSRVTTKSNTYTVHWRVQTLKKSVGTLPTQWTEGTDQVTSELRGSTLIDRFIDPNANLPDYASNTAAVTGEAIQPMGYYYKWRVASETYFQPSP